MGKNYSMLGVTLSFVLILIFCVLYFKSSHIEANTLSYEKYDYIKYRYVYKGDTTYILRKPIVYKKITYNYKQKI